MKNSKKILIISSEFPPQPGGIGNHAYNLADQLQKNGYEVGLLADVRSADGLVEQQFDTSVSFDIYRIKRYKILLWTYLKRIIVYKRLSYKYSTIIASGKFPLWMVGLDPFLSKNKKYAVIHGSEVNLQGFNKKFTDKALQNFKKIVAVSNFTKSLIDELNLKNIIVIPNGFSLPHLEIEKSINKAINKEYPTLITVGNVTQRKGQLNVIKALPRLLELYPNLHYHIVGIPTEQKNFEKIALALKVLDHITFHGNVNDKVKYKLLHKSDIFVMLSNSTNKGDVEGFGIAIIEANSLGLPAIGSFNSGIADAINEKYSGRLIDQLNVDNLVEAYEDIFENYENYTKQSKDWSKQFEWSIIIKKYASIFE